MGKVHKFSSKLYLTTIITFIGLVSAIITIYAFYFQKSETKINYEIVTNSNVFDINTNISKLDILYDSTSLKKTNENLRVMSIKVKNVGNINILKSFYDDKSPLGLKIQNGYIVETPELVGFSNDYLKNNLTITKDSSNCILFSDIILEQEEFFEIKFLVLHQTNEIPKIKPIGKIAGVKNVNIINSSEVIQETSFWSKVFIGNIFVQLVKGILYFLIVLSLIIGSAALADYINGKIQRRKKRKVIKAFKLKSTYRHKKINDPIFENFENGGLGELKRMFGILADENGINEFNIRWKEILKVKEEKEAIVKAYVDIEDISLPNGYKASRKDERNYYLIRSLIDEGFIISNNDGLIVNKDMKKTLESFIDYLKETKYKENDSYQRTLINDEEIKNAKIEKK